MTWKDRRSYIRCFDRIIRWLSIEKWRRKDLRRRNSRADSVAMTPHFHRRCGSLVHLSNDDTTATRWYARLGIWFRIEDVLRLLSAVEKKYSFISFFVRIYFLLFVQNQCWARVQPWSRTQSGSAPWRTDLWGGSNTSVCILWYLFERLGNHEWAFQIFV